MPLQDILNFEVDANILHTFNSPSVYHLLGHENVFMSDKEMKISKSHLVIRKHQKHEKNVTTASDFMH